MKGTKAQKGITLIALIITIVVLLILAVVAIGAVKDSNIIAHAQKAGSDYTIAQEKEQIGLAVSEYQIQKTILGEIETLFYDTVKNALEETANVTPNEDGTLTVIFNKTRNVYIVDKNGNITKQEDYEDDDEEDGGETVTNDFEITVSKYASDTPESIILYIQPTDIPDSWNKAMNFTDDEAASYVLEMMDETDLTSLVELDIYMYNMLNSTSLAYDQFSIVKTELGITTTDEEEAAREAFAQLATTANLSCNTVQEWAASIYEYEPETCSLKIRKGDGELTDVTEEANWEGCNVGYEVTSNGTYEIQLELDGNISIKQYKLIYFDDVGKYVKYDANGNGSVEDEILYRVLYTEEALGEGEGAQIISNDVLLPESVRLGPEDNTIPEGAVITDLNGDGDLNFEKALYSYNHAVEILNAKCAALPEAKHVEGITRRVRSVGSDPLIEEDTDDKFYKTDIPNYTGTWFDKYDGLFKEESNSNDYNILNARGMGATPSSKSYWLATRDIDICEDITATVIAIEFEIKQGVESGFSERGYGLVNIDTDGDVKQWNYSCGLRPVIVLEPGVFLTAICNNPGSGTEKDPYILK